LTHRLLFILISLPIFNQYSRLLLHLPCITLTPRRRTPTIPLPTIREPTATPLLGGPMLLRCLGPSPLHLHLQEPFLLIVDEPLKLLLHLDLVAQLPRHLRVREKGRTHHLTSGGGRLRGVRLARCCLLLHHYFVVFKGTCLQLGYVNFPSFRTLFSRIRLL
jgi:hypothetical protein